MRIAYLVRCMTNGGAEKVAAQLTWIWKSLGHEVVLLTELPPVENEYECFFNAREKINVSGDAEQEVRRLYRKYKFDAFVFNDAINDGWFPSMFVAVRSLQIVKVVVLMHHTANNWMYGLGNTRELGIDHLLAQSDLIVCVDKIWALWWTYRNVPVAYIHNPVTVSEQGHTGSGDESKEIVWAGRIQDAGKRPELAIEVFDRVLSSVPGTHLTMLGSKTKRAELALLKGRRASVVGNVSFPGFVTDIFNRMSCAAVHIFTSLTEVTVPQVILEAQSCGLQTVALDQPVLRGVPGVRIARDVEEMSALCLELLSCKKRRDMGLVSYAASVRSEMVVRWTDALAALECGKEREWIVSCRKDLFTSENHQNLMDELHRAQHFFAERYLPELLWHRKWKKRMDVGYLKDRLRKKFIPRTED